MLQNDNYYQPTHVKKWFVFQGKPSNYISNGLDSLKYSKEQKKVLLMLGGFAMFGDLKLKYN